MSLYQSWKKEFVFNNYCHWAVDVMARVEVGNRTNKLTTEDMEFVASQHCS